MSVTSAWRRFGVVASREAIRQRGAHATLAPVSSAQIRAAWGWLEAVLFLKGIVLGPIVLVKAVDAILDRLFGWQ